MPIIANINATTPPHFNGCRGDYEIAAGAVLMRSTPFSYCFLEEWIRKGIGRAHHKGLCSQQAGQRCHAQFLHASHAACSPYSVGCQL